MFIRCCYDFNRVLNYAFVDLKSLNNIIRRNYIYFSLEKSVSKFKMCKV